MKLTNKLRQHLESKGLLPRGTGRKPPIVADGKSTKLFDSLCEAHGLPVPVHEFEFAAEIGRNWRADWVFEGWLIVEQVGGVWTSGHHSRGQTQIDDMERRNTAQILGYVVLEFTPEQIESGAAFGVIRKALAAREQP
jgi:hypothetical protein